MRDTRKRVTRKLKFSCAGLLWLACLVVVSPAAIATEALISLNLKDMEISSVMEMLARKNRINLLLGEGVSGKVSINLFDVTHDEAIRAIAESAGFAVERRRGSYFIVPPASVGRLSNGVTRVRNFQLNYADPDAVGELLESHISQFGQVTVLTERNLVIVADTPQFLRRIEQLVKYADAAPAQVLIEAQILEVALTDEDSYGINWSKLFESDGGSGSFGGRGLFGAGNSANAGFLFELITPNVDVQLSALQQEGRVRTLSTPTLIALDNQEASVIIGDRRGYQVTTTINQVTTESIEFLESGVILRVTPKVDARGNILLDIHPEVSTGTVDANGIPSQATTEVTTSLLVPDGETVFIGGLIKHTQTQGYQRVPVLGRVPVIKSLFRSKERTNVNTETVVLITPRLQISATTESVDPTLDAQKEKVAKLAEEFEGNAASIDRRVDLEEAGLLDDPHRSPSHPPKARTVEPFTQPGLSTETQLGADPEIEHEHERETGPELNYKAALDSAVAKPYAVQVMQLSSKESLLWFLKANALEHLPYVPVPARSGEAFAVLLGYYDTFDAAHVAAANLPASLAHTKPWIRKSAELYPRP